MADIELVIKIDEEVKRAFDCAESNDLKGCYYDHGGVIGNAIKSGTPLPKGRIIDADELLKQILEQEYILDKIRAEIKIYEADCRLQGGTDECEKCNSNVFGSVYRIIDKYKTESEHKRIIDADELLKRILEQEYILDKIQAEIGNLTVPENDLHYIRKSAELYALKVKLYEIINKYR